MTEQRTTDVLIVGAGPTGLALASTLAHRSISAMVVDRAAAGTNTSRAAVVHARTLDVLQRIGLADRLIAQGLIVPRFSVRHRDRVLMRIGFQEINSPHPYTLMLPQSSTERLLAEALPSDLPVLRGRSIESFIDDGTQVTAVVVDGGGTKSEIIARSIVGCDGMHSRVRELAGIGFQGERYAQSFLLADVRMNWPIQRDEVELFFSPDGLVVVAPLPDDRFRIVATSAPTSVQQVPAAPDGTAIQKLLDRRGPANRQAQVREVLWSSHFAVHHRLAASYRIGNTYLAGDAAHVHSPAGGQGMNLGIQDAVDLGNMLADSCADRSVDLDGYQARRRPRAEQVIRLTDRMTRAATIGHPPVPWVRDQVLAAAGRIPVIPRALARELSGVRSSRR